MREWIVIVVLYVAPFGFFASSAASAPRSTHCAGGAEASTTLCELSSSG